MKIFFCTVLLMRSQRVGHNWATELNWLCICANWLCVFLPYLLLLLGPYHFCPLLCPSLHEIFHMVSLIFLKRSLVFPFLLLSSALITDFFALITEEGFLISPCYTLELCIPMGISFLFSFSFTSLLLIAICKASSDTILPFCPLGDGIDHCLLYNAMNFHQ